MRLKTLNFAEAKQVALLCLHVKDVALREVEKLLKRKKYPYKKDMSLPLKAARHVTSEELLLINFNPCQPMDAYTQ